MQNGRNVDHGRLLPRFAAARDVLVASSTLRRSIQSPRALQEASAAASDSQGVALRRASLRALDGLSAFDHSNVAIGRAGRLRAFLLRPDVL